MLCDEEYYVNFFFVPFILLYAHKRCYGMQNNLLFSKLKATMEFQSHF